MANFAILRIEKVKSLKHLAARARHNSRSDDQGIEHCDPERRARLLMGKDDAQQAWHEKMEAAKIDPSKVRKDATVAIEWIATASPEWWKNASPREKTEWLGTNVEFLTKRAGGKKNILSMHLHDDESTPHIQAISIPLIEKEVKVRGRPKRGTKPSSTGTVATSLCAKDIIGGHRDTLVHLQDDYAEAMKPHGLVRGLPRKETGARNKSPSYWRSEQAAETDKLRQSAAEAKEIADKAWDLRKKAQEKAMKAEEDRMKILALAHQQAAQIINEARDRATALISTVDEMVAVREAAKKLDIPAPERPTPAQVAQARRKREQDSR